VQRVAAEQAATPTRPARWDRSASTTEPVGEIALAPVPGLPRLPHPGLGADAVAGSSAPRRAYPEFASIPIRDDKAITARERRGRRRSAYSAGQETPRAPWRAPEPTLPGPSVAHGDGLAGQPPDGRTPWGRPGRIWASWGISWPAARSPPDSAELAMGLERWRSLAEWGRRAGTSRGEPEHDRAADSARRARSNSLGRAYRG
jgi:hypothetical protein